MADLVPAADLQAGDVMLDPAGDLDVIDVRPVDSMVRVHVVSVDREFETVWLFGPDELCRVVTRPGLTSVRDRRPAGQSLNRGPAQAAADDGPGVAGSAAAAGQT